MGELAGALLHALSERLAGGAAIIMGNCVGDVGDLYGQYGLGRHHGTMDAAAEAWDWLYVNGLIGQHPQHSPGWFRITRRGHAAVAAADFSKWISDQEMPDAMLHEQLRGLALSLFRQGQFETAVFEAFKSLEVSIRDAAGLGFDLVGVQLASRAFHVEDGPLTDPSSEKGERVALMNLMTGALGSYKNPASHRRVEIAAAEAREMMFLASHLLRIVDARRSQP